MYSDSTPGSIKQAWPRMRIAEDPTSQKKVDTGDASHSSGRPASQFSETTVFSLLTNDKETDVEVFLGDCSITELNRLRGKLVDSGESTR